MKTFFLADMHLKPQGNNYNNKTKKTEVSRERLKKIIDYMIPVANKVILLGDTFHFWFERNGKVVGDYNAELEILSKLNKNNIQVYHISGNRDFAIGSALSKTQDKIYKGFFHKLKESLLNYYGIIPMGEKYVFQQNNKKILCLHGDSLVRGNYSFKLTRILFQGIMGKIVMRYLPWAIMSKIGKHLQTPSSFAVSYKRKKISERIDSNLILKQFIKNKIDIMVIGHFHDYFHKGLIINGEKKDFYILPSWQDGYFAYLDNDKLTVKNYSDIVKD